MAQCNSNPSYTCIGPGGSCRSLSSGCAHDKKDREDRERDARGASDTGGQGNSSGSGFIAVVVSLALGAVLWNFFAARKADPSPILPITASPKEFSPTTPDGVQSSPSAPPIPTPETGASDHGSVVVVQGRRPDAPQAESTTGPVRAAPHIAIGDCLSVDAYPHQALRAEAMGTTRLRLKVASDGLVIGAEVLGSAGPTREHRLLDRAAVTELVDRCRGVPQTDSEGVPVEGSLDIDVVWKID